MWVAAPAGAAAEVDDLALCLSDLAPGYVVAAHPASELGPSSS